MYRKFKIFKVLTHIWQLYCKWLKYSRSILDVYRHTHLYNHIMPYHVRVGEGMTLLRKADNELYLACRSVSNPYMSNKHVKSYT